MKFLTVLMLVIYYRNWMGNNPLRDMFPLDTWFSWVGARLSGDSLRFLFSVILPTMVVLLVSFQLTGVFLGMFWLVLSVAIVLYCVDIVDTDIVFDDQILWLRDLKETDDLVQLQQSQLNFSHDVVYNVFQSVIPVVFWFLMLGPAGSLFFLLCQHFLERLDGEGKELGFLDTIVYWLEWIPSRLTILLFALLGDFGRTYQVLADSIFDIETPVDTTLYESARCAVVGDNDSGTKKVIHKFVALAEGELKDLKLLLERSLWGWVGVAALLTILGL